MKFSSSYTGSISNVCSKEQSRYSLSSPFLDTERKILFATDGRMLVGIPVIISEGDTSGLVDLRAIKEYQSAMKTWRKTRLSYTSAQRPKEPTLLCGEVTSFSGSDGSTMSFPRPVGEFPKLEKLFDHETGVAVRINPLLLKSMYAAMQHDRTMASITLFLPEDANKAIVVSAQQDSTSAMGLLMPMRGNDERPTLEKLTVKA